MPGAERTAEPEIDCVHATFVIRTSAAARQSARRQTMAGMVEDNAFCGLIE
ncbi:hypothetical protein GCM10023114_09470 [Mycolicibacterium sediminis]|uniref:Uncharacterized protein n=1 Tax=Mycolicibacterium sediminis TaxID=1286180 RepID=A0A7I7QS16_9MYCO|nr:hypothetical protein MSEDJ_32850 [Mycolicibacterium sediminis]